MPRVTRLSLGRIADLGEYEIEPLPRARWAFGDYVVGRVTKPPGREVSIELANGRMFEVDVDDHLLGAFGVRFATLEATGDWREIGDDGRMHALTGAGLMGKLTSKSPFFPNLTELRYVGHVIVDGDKATMRQFAKTGQKSFQLPVVLIVGSSMSAGKTKSARIIIRRLRRQGLRVTAAKLTGAGRYRDALSMGDAGADHIFDFVDAGLPSTICEEDEYRDAIKPLLSHIADIGDDVAVIEAGASPLEPYNGRAVLDLLRRHIKLLVLCASDPYSVVGMSSAFGVQPDLIAGVACNTLAGMQLIDRLTGLPALRLTDAASLVALDEMLRAKLALA